MKESRARARARALASECDATVVSQLRFDRIGYRLVVSGALRQRAAGVGKGIDEASSCRLDNSINSTFVQGPFIYVESH